MEATFDATIKEHWRTEAEQRDRVREYRELRSRQAWLTRLLNQAELCLLHEKQPTARLAGIVKKLSEEVGIPVPAEGAMNLVDHLFAIQEKTMDRLREIYEARTGLDFSDTKTDPDEIPWVP